MVIANKENRGLSMKDSARLSLIRVSLTPDARGLKLSAEDQEDLVIYPLKNRNGAQVHKLNVLGQSTEGIDVGQGSAEWFSRFLGQPVTLMQSLPELKQRGSKIEGSVAAISATLPRSFQQQSRFKQVQAPVSGASQALLMHCPHRSTF